MILEPQEYFTIVRQLHDWQDTDANYVLAVVREARTDKLIATIKLDNKGDRRFSKEWQVSADPSGMGFYVTIATTVYTDDQYTLKNPNYGEELNTYLVDSRHKSKGGGGGVQVDYKKIQGIFAENSKYIVDLLLPKLETFVQEKMLNSGNALEASIGNLSTNIEIIANKVLSDDSKEINVMASENGIDTKGIHTDIFKILEAQRVLNDLMKQIADKDSSTLLEQIMASESTKIIKEIGEQIDDSTTSIVERINVLDAPEPMEEDTMVQEDTPVQAKVKNLMS